MNLTEKPFAKSKSKSPSPKLEALRDMSFLRDSWTERPGRQAPPTAAVEGRHGRTKYDDDAEDETDSGREEELELAKKHRGPIAVLEI